MAAASALQSMSSLQTRIYAVQSKHAPIVRILMVSLASICTFVLARTSGSAWNTSTPTTGGASSMSSTQTSGRYMAIRPSGDTWQYNTPSHSRSQTCLTFPLFIVQFGDLLLSSPQHFYYALSGSGGFNTPIRVQKNHKNDINAGLTTVGFEPTRFYPQVGLKQERMLQVNLKLAP